MVRNANVNVNNDLYFTLYCELLWVTTKSQELEIFYHTHAGAIEGVVGEGKSVSWGGIWTKVEVHKRKLTKNMFLHSDLLTSLSSSLKKRFLKIRKLALRGNEWEEKAI